MGQILNFLIKGAKAPYSLTVSSSVSKGPLLSLLLLPEGLSLRASPPSSESLPKSAIADREFGACKIKSLSNWNLSLTRQIIINFDYFDPKKLERQTFNLIQTVDYGELNYPIQATGLSFNFLLLKQHKEMDHKLWEVRA